MQRIKAVDRGLEDLVVGPEGDGGARGLGLAHHGHLLDGLAAGKLHLVDVAVALDLHHEALGEGVDDGAAHTVQAAGDLVGGVVKLATCMQDGQDDLKGRNLLDGVLVHGDAAAVVYDGDGVIGVDCHLDLVAEAGEGLVNGVVHDLVHQVVQSAGARRANVHARALADGLKTLEDLDLAAVVAVLLCHASSSLGALLPALAVHATFVELRADAKNRHSLTMIAPSKGRERTSEAPSQFLASFIPLPTHTRGHGLRDALPEPRRQPRRLSLYLFPLPS